MRKMLAGVAVAVGLVVGVSAAVSGSLTVNTLAPVAGGSVQLVATIEGLTEPNSSPSAISVGNVDMQCYQGDTLVLDYPQMTLFWNTSTLGSPYAIDFNLYFTGAASCEAHLWSYKLSGGTSKLPKRTKSNTIATVSFNVGA
jgi:hypothetical protein